jgi:large subunit ribosomal protein L22
MRIGEVIFQYNHYYVKLEEGTPPKHFYKPDLTGEEMLQKWLQQMRSRHIQNSI